MSQRDYYESLDITKNASESEIKKAYHRLAAKFHPDKGGSETKFEEIKQAYDVLSDAKKRTAYDVSLLHISLAQKIKKTAKREEHQETREEELKWIFNDSNYQRHFFFQPKYKKTEDSERSKRAKEKQCRICHGSGFVRYNTQPELGFIGIEERLCSCQIVSPPR